MKKIAMLTALATLIMNTSMSYAESTFKEASTPIIAAYFGIWTENGQTWEQKFRDDTPFDKLNRLYISFGKIVPLPNKHFTIAFDGPTERVQALVQRMKKVNETADIFLVVGGDNMSNSYGGAANDPLFANNVLQFLTQYNLNGFDIDWESGLDKTNLNHLVKNLSATLHANNVKLTLDVWPYPVVEYDMNVLKTNLDQINIMSYGTRSDLKNSANHFGGFPLNQIIGGIETETLYHNQDTLGPNGSIAAKDSFALNVGLAGMMSWRLDNDYAPRDNLNHPTYQAAIQLWNDMTSGK